jgi:hypothetical protein
VPADGKCSNRPHVASAPHSASPSPSTTAHSPARRPGPPSLPAPQPSPRLHLFLQLCAKHAIELLHVVLVHGVPRSPAKAGRQVLGAGWRFAVLELQRRGAGAAAVRGQGRPDRWTQGARGRERARVGDGRRAGVPARPALGHDGVCGGAATPRPLPPAFGRHLVEQGLQRQRYARAGFAVLLGGHVVHRLPCSGVAGQPRGEDGQEGGAEGGGA